LLKQKEIIHLNDEIDGYKTISQENKFLKNNIKNLESQIKELKSKQKTKSIAKEVKGDIIHNMKELEALNPETEAARISASIGKRKKLLMLDKASELGIKVLNK